MNITSIGRGQGRTPIFFHISCLPTNMFRNIILPSEKSEHHHGFKVLFTKEQIQSSGQICLTLDPVYSSLLGSIIENQSVKEMKAK